jgi:hypothetical protein
VQGEEPPRKVLMLIQTIVKNLSMGFDQGYHGAPIMRSEQAEELSNEWLNISNCDVAI